MDAAAVDFPLNTKSASATVKIHNIASLPGVLRDFGVDPDRLLRDVGVEPALFAAPDSVIPYAKAGRLIARCARETGSDDFGLRIGIRRGPPAIGLTGLVSVNSPTVREGVRVILGALRTSDTGGVAFLDVRGGVAAFGYAVVAPDVEGVDQIEDLSIAIGANIMRQLCGPGWRPLRVCFARNAPRDRSLFARFFNVPLDFSERRTCLEFDPAVLEWPVGISNPEYAEILSPLLHEAVALATPDFLSSVKAAVRAQVAAGTLSRGAVCRTLGMNARTLAYRLGTCGVNYSALAEEARYDAARNFLLGEKTIGEIASALGFAEQSAFTRAFKAWSGATPARWRAAYR